MEKLSNNKYKYTIYVLKKYKALKPANQPNNK